MKYPIGNYKSALQAKCSLKKYEDLSVVGKKIFKSKSIKDLKRIIKRYEDSHPDQANHDQ